MRIVLKPFQQSPDYIKLALNFQGCSAKLRPSPVIGKFSDLTPENQSCANEVPYPFVVKTSLQAKLCRELLR